MAHQNRKFICEICLKEFKHKCTLAKHIKNLHKTSKSTEQSKKANTIYIHRASYAEKLSGVQCCENEFKKILIDDKNYRREIETN